ncbi:MAG: Mrp/NBP35 family ATP-binding protein [Gemmatimonadetes bacterium]|nr:Mrp/NBP35 family ATP-binding protein [Gemmatimonadota bacterium]
MSTLQQRIATALASVSHPRAPTSLLEDQVVRDVGVTLDGKVRLTVVIGASDDPTLVRDVRRAIEAVEGVTDVRIDVRDPAEFQRAAPPPPPAARPAARALPVMDDRPAAAPRGSVPPPVAYPHLGHVIAVSSGKGGVGKSTLSVNLAVALAQRGWRVGIMDADVYGPNLPLMLGVNAAPPVVNEKIQPLEAHGVKVMSLGFLIEREQPAIWRGPIVMKIVTQFLRDVNWGELDAFLVDMPPGTGDAQLSLVQATNVRGALIVTTPQQVATGDALRGAMMFNRVNVPVLGIIENMSWFECPHCGKPTALFGSGGGKALAEELQLDLLGQVPLYPRIVEGGDTGRPIVVADPESPAARAIADIAARVQDLLGPARSR